MAIDSADAKTWKQALEYSAGLSDAQRINLGVRNLKSMLKYGFTTVRDLGNSGFFLDYKLSEHLSRNKIYVPNFISTGPGISFSTSQIDHLNYPNEYNVIGENTNIDVLLDLYKKMNKSWIKVYADNSKKDEHLNENNLIQFVKKAKSRNFKVAIHSEFSESAKSALQSGANSLEHMYEVADLDLENQQQNVVLTVENYSDCINFEKSSFAHNSICKNKHNNQIQQIQKLKDKLFSLIFGSDAVLDSASGYTERGLHAIDILISLKEFNFKPKDMIKAATSLPSEKLFGSNYGIKVGAEADISVYETDPEENPEILRHPVLIIKSGKVVYQK